MHNKLKIKRLLIVLMSFISLLLLSFLYYYINRKYNIGFKCIFHEITNLYCPGCGITRAIFSLLELNIIQAIKYNILIITVIPLILFNYLIKIISWINLKEQKEVYPKTMWNIILIFVILFGIIRNIEIISFLAP